MFSIAFFPPCFFINLTFFTAACPEALSVLFVLKRGEPQVCDHADIGFKALDGAALHRISYIPCVTRFSTDVFTN
uniref:Uncharacterized protein n=1 Tax=Anguilla anguilla TaxID=7936 RepID=A0A0E9U8M3_ANGAN